MADRAPLAAQYVAYLLPRLAHADLAHPASRQARLAVAKAAHEAGLTIMPTRRELTQAILYLRASGVLPAAEAPSAERDEAAHA